MEKPNILWTTDNKDNVFRRYLWLKHALSLTLYEISKFSPKGSFGKK